MFYESVWTSTTTIKNYWSARGEILSHVISFMVYRTL